MTLLPVVKRAVPVSVLTVALWAGGKPSAGDIYLLGNVPHNHFVQNLSPKKHHSWGFSGVLGGHFGDSVGCVGF